MRSHKQKLGRWVLQPCTTPGLVAKYKCFDTKGRAIMLLDVAERAVEYSIALRKNRQDFDDVCGTKRLPARRLHARNGVIYASRVYSMPYRYDRSGVEINGLANYGKKTCEAEYRREHNLE